MKKLTALKTTHLFLGIFFLLCAGCSTKGVMNPYKKSELNVLGIVHNRPHSFNPVPKTNIPISYGDVLPNRENFSGRELRLLWGLITVTDY